MPALLMDLWAAGRATLRRRWASAGVVATLAVGLAGAATAASIAHAGLLRALPFPDADRLVRLARIYTPNGLESGLPLADVDAWRLRLAPEARLAGMSTERVVVRQAGAPTAVNAGYVIGDFFDVHGMPPAAGRTFDDADRNPVAVVSWAFARRIGAAPGASIGRLIDVGGETLTIVGVMPASFSVDARQIEVWVNGRNTAPLRLLGPTDARYYSLMARLAPDSTIQRFSDRATAVMNDLAPETQRGNWQLVVTPLRDALIGDAGTTLVLFLIAAALFLAVACANAAVLLINGIVSRTREAAVRLSLGAGVWRLLRLHWFEMAWLVAAGGLAGWWLAAAATRALGTLPGVSLPAVAVLAPDVALATGIGVLIVMLGCGAAQLAALGQTRRAAALRGPAATPSPGSRRLRGALVLAQVAMAIVLLTTAGLLGRAFLDLAATDIGLDDRDHVFSMSVPIGDSITAPDDGARAAWLTALLERIRAVPGVASAGAGGALPPAVGQMAFTIRRVTDTDDATARFDVVSGTDGYLDALGARLVRGRLFTAAEAERGEAVTVASESAIRHLGLSLDDVGSPLNMALPSASGERVRPQLVGVIEDVRFTGVAADDTGSLFMPWRRLPNPTAFLVVRAAGDPAAAMAAVAALAQAADPTLPAAAPERLQTVIDRTIAPQSARFALVMVSAGAAVLLALVGLSGTLARWVVERERELAIRAAIGAAPADLLRSTLGRGLALAAAGAGAGLLLAVVAGRLLASTVAGVAASDPALMAATAAAVLLLAAVAAAVPARRASKADPIALLRSE